MICKCQFPDWLNVKPDGINSLDPCLYKRVEMHKNVNVFVDQCVKCGHIEIAWESTDDTESIIYDELSDGEDEAVVQRTLWDDDGYNDFDDGEEDDEWMDNLD